MVVDTPNSLIERGRLEEGKAVLRRIRGTDKIEPEYLELVEASRVAKEVKHPFRNLLKRRNRPQLIIAMSLQVIRNQYFKNEIYTSMFMNFYCEFNALKMLPTHTNVHKFGHVRWDGRKGMPGGARALALLKIFSIIVLVF